MNNTTGLLQAARTPFANEPAVVFDAAAAAAMRDALETVRAQLGREYSLVIGGAPVATDARVISTNPARPSQIVGAHAAASTALAARAVEEARRAFETWRFAPLETRVGVLLRAAGVLRARKFELCAWLAYEVGKNWAEADAEVAEAIDFLEYYAREAVRLAEPQPPVQMTGERDAFVYIPLGPGVVLPPWNFPLAILAGMTAAAVVCGNTVVLKPSPDAPTIAAVFFDILQGAGLPSGVVTLCQGGAELGKALVEHPHTRFIAFTGSKAAGLDINARAAAARPGQRWIKRTILEMGGKDAIIVDADADLDEAALGVTSSAFGFNGQKCSACSRVIIAERVYNDFMTRLLERVRHLQHGDPAGNFSIGPVINRSAYDKVLSYLAIGRTEGQLAVGGEALTRPEDGYYIAPTVITGASPNARISQEEIFGPVLVALRARDFDEALDIANATEYGLTGAVYSTSAATLARARAEFHVGNLYLNRKCTGALVGVHPFGGFNMSGTDSKAGGPDYLLLFTQGKSIAERIR